MSKLTLYTAQGEKTGELDFPEQLLVTDRGEQAVHDAVLAFQANRRAGTAKTKKRGEVSGGGIKPFKQKGTGRARAGSIRSPIWRGGGVVFGPQPRDYSIRLNKRVVRLAFARAFSERLADGSVLVVERFAPAQPKTRLLAELLKKLGVQKGALLINEATDRNLTLAVRNMAKVEVAQAADVNTYQVLRYPQVVVSKAALEKLEQRMKNLGRRAA
ncbi:MAG: 50S ribosomal protein L4 [Verrucomicrobia bacterium]|nr:MAG: 50S ribosomal protein L4 [Verrucomicrobiota bacterium]